jgi:bifunctional ADP-heptose synthase (sugar kinase/adenylyltransferase)
LKFLIQSINPDVRFLGDDYLEKPYTGDDLGIPIHWISRSHGWSTTKFKKQISKSI